MSSPEDKIFICHFSELLIINHSKFKSLLKGVDIFMSNRKSDQNGHMAIQPYNLNSLLLFCLQKRPVGHLTLITMFGNHVDIKFFVRCLFRLKGWNAVLKTNLTNNNGNILSALFVLFFLKHSWIFLEGNDKKLPRLVFSTDKTRILISLEIGSPS